MSDYQGFAWFFFCFQWSAWVMNQTLFLPQYQHFHKFWLCIRHALVLKNCLLLSGVCLPTSWVQMYALFLNYASGWLWIYIVQVQGASVYIYTLAPCTEKKYDEICYLEYCSYICEQYSRYGRKERLYCYAGTVGKICQSIGTSCPNCYYALFGKAENVLFWGYSRRTSHCQSNRITALERVERCRTYTRRGWNA